MNKVSESTSSFLVIVQLIFIIAKVFGFWNVGWSVVLIPLWIQCGVLAIILLIWFIALLVYWTANK